MPILECPNVYELVLPDGFRVFGEAGQYDIEAPEGMGLGLNLSYYRITSQMMADGAAKVLTAFVSSTGASTEGLKITTASGEGDRAFTSFTKDGHDWFAGFLIFPNGGVLATATTESGNEALRLGEQLIASIYPIKPRRGLFGRR